MSGLAESAAATLVVLGEPGIGKTRLLRELAATADEAGQIVLSGSASELESDLPFWVFVVSLKTVEAHMRNLFRKLGVSSRAEVARTVERAERNQGSS